MADDLKTAHEKLTKRVMGRPGVSGTAIGQKGGKPCLTVYVSDSNAGRSIPKREGGFPVVIERTGPFKRL